MMLIHKLVLLAMLALAANAKNKSPCPGLFQYISQEPGLTKADVTLYSDVELNGIWVRLIFDSKLEQLSSETDVEFASTDNSQFLMKNRNLTLEAGKPLKIRLLMKYEGDKAPKLIGFRLNARTVCPENGENYNWINKVDEQESNNFFLGDLNNRDFLYSRRQPVSEIGCGTVPLLENSENSKNNGEGKWPWQASIYLVNEKAKNYVCAATLISPNHVITAAHCVTHKNSENPLYPNTLTVRLGEHFVNYENRGLQELKVAEVSVHPGYNHINLDNNLALIKLDGAAKLTDFVRPICLWEGPVNVHNVLKKEGFVVGYGFDEENHYTDRLTNAKLDAVASDVCLNDKPELAPYLSSKSMCASYSKGNNVCVGESGSGVTYIRDAPNLTYQLRGVVSVGPALQNNLLCDHSNYIIITDTVKHLQWIKITLLAS